MDETERAQCTGINYHSMQRSLTKLGYWPPLHHSQGIYDSAQEVANALSSIQVLKYARMRDVDLHAPCDAGRQLADRVTAVAHELPDPVDIDTLHRLAQNGAELACGEALGFSPGELDS
jgi:hypothetical protein